jgi:hypothetical protein
MRVTNGTFLTTGSVYVTPKLVRLRFSLHAQRVPDTFNRSARHAHGYDDPCRPSLKHLAKTALAIFEGDAGINHPLKEDLNRPYPASIGGRR